MNITLRTGLAVALVTLSAIACAQDSAEAARQQHRDARAEDRARHDAHGSGGGGGGGSVRQDVHNLGHSIHQGVRETGHAIHHGVRATGHAIHQGVKATGHAIHQGVDKLTGR